MAKEQIYVEKPPIKTSDYRTSDASFARESGYALKGDNFFKK